uniref:Uncharacterized protein n=1 Tax=Streptomyces sp. W75 TaxID=1170711 RepID=I0CEB5_9ACTN|nr:hypothetical protein [Streptomyces sp. W75]AFH75128.1 hypothetical protein pCQ4.3 [Streptomyces sp. W75]
MNTPPTVWLLMQGVDDAITDVLGVYAHREAGRTALTHATHSLSSTVDRSEEDEDGTIRVYGPLRVSGVEWLELSPHAVTADEAEAGESK